MPVEMSRAAARLVRRQGGSVYVWVSPVGGTDGILHAATKQPPSIRFTCLPLGSLEVCFDAESAMSDQTVRVERRIVPPWGVGASVKDGVASAGLSGG